MRRTGFGLTQIDPGESPWEDGGSFFGRNQDIIDHLLRLGALTHRHDAHAALAAPTVAPTVAASGTGGQLDAGIDIFVAVTGIDADGGETLPVTTSVTTPGALNVPAAPTGTPGYTAGDLPANTYYYAVTATDGAGGETAPSDPLVVVVEAGHANGEVALAGMQTAAAAVGGTGWRLYRSVNGGPYGFLASGNTDAFTDDCSHCADTQLPPPDDTGTTAAGSAKVTVTMPAADLPAGTVNYRIYASGDPTFPEPALFGEFAVADAGTAHAVTTLALNGGQPPVVATAVGGAPLLSSADFDIRWKDPVATAADLPGAANTVGDVRATLDDHALHLWDGASWQSAGGGGTLLVDANPATELDMNVGLRSRVEAPNQVALTADMWGLGAETFGSAASLTDPGYTIQNMALDVGPPTAAMAAAAGDDARWATLATAANISSDSPQRSWAQFRAPAADDKFGTSVKNLDIANFLEGRVNNAAGAPALELVAVDAGVETLLASTPLAAAVTTRCWLRTELFLDAWLGIGELAVALYFANPGMTVAAPAALLAIDLTAAQDTKYGQGVVAGYGFRLQPAAGGANGLRVPFWIGHGG